MRILFQCIACILMLTYSNTDTQTYNDFVDASMDVQNCEAFTSANSFYDNFRKYYPFHFQTVGLAGFPDDSYLFLISEPTPTMTEEKIRQVFADFDYSLHIKKHKLGYDGYIKDVLVIVKFAKQEQIIQLENNLHKLLFSTDYKAEKATLKLPVAEGRRFFSSSNLNYQISLPELNDWFITNKELFMVPNNQKVTVQSLLTNGKPGVYLSARPGFVAWVINKNEDLSEQKSIIREFSLDSDLLLGAFSNNQKLIIIGRERNCSLSELPPLCTETVLLLASCSQPQLSQSLDIMDVLAGKIASRGYDWCPTYLSNELENTELGNLLTISDLVLKGWSESGLMKSWDFYYPSPQRYPFVKPLSDLFQEKKEISRGKTGFDSKKEINVCLVYNWNTSDAFYSMKIADFSIYAIASTGALPVSYFNDQYSGISIGKDYEAKAYEYFANISNTDLARVVQYQTLYSLFYDNAIYSNTNPLVVASSSKKPYLMEDWTKRLLSEIKNTTQEECTRIAHRFAEDAIRNEIKDSIVIIRQEFKKNFDAAINDEIKRKGLSRSDPQIAEQINQYWKAELNDFNKRIEEAIQEQIDIAETSISQKISSVQNELNSMNSAEFIEAYRFISYPRGTKYAFNIDSNKMRALIEDINGMFDGVHKDIYQSFGVDLAKVMDYYSGALQNESSLWIKTPTLTRTFGGYNAVGGHNLSSSLRMVKSLTEYVPRFRGASINTDTRSRFSVIPEIREHRGL